MSNHQSVSLDGLVWRTLSRAPGCDVWCCHSWGHQAGTSSVVRNLVMDVTMSQSSITKDSSLDT